jgi:hypothetical protein
MEAEKLVCVPGTMKIEITSTEEVEPGYWGRGRFNH